MNPNKALRVWQSVREQSEKHIAVVRRALEEELENN